MTKIWLVTKIQGYLEDRESTNIKAFDSESEAELYRDKITKSFKKLHIGYSQIIYDYEFGDIMEMEDDVYDKYDLLNTKKRKYYDVYFYIDEIELVTNNSEIKYSGYKDKHGVKIYENNILQGANSVIYSVHFNGVDFYMFAEKYFVEDKSGDARNDYPSGFLMSDVDFQSITIIK